MKYKAEGYKCPIPGCGAIFPTPQSRGVHGRVGHRRRKTWSHRESLARNNVVHEQIEDLVERNIKKFNITRTTAVRDVQSESDCLSLSKRKKSRFLESVKT